MCSKRNCRSPNCKLSHPLCSVLILSPFVFQFVCQKERACQASPQLTKEFVVERNCISSWDKTDKRIRNTFVESYPMMFIGKENWPKKCTLVAARKTLAHNCSCGTCETTPGILLPPDLAALDSWRPSLVGWRPSLLGWRPPLLGARSYY